ncbi:MAG: hypothetical protein ACXVB9_19005 [Bdellovibrionota bacterium]
MRAYFLFLFLASSAFGAPCTKWEDNSCLFSYPVTSTTHLPLYSTYPLDAPNASLTRAVVIVHGLGYDPEKNFRQLLWLYGEADHLNDTLILAPYFAREEDQPGEGSARWAGNQWCSGEPSSAPEEISSFAMIDSLLRGVHARFPGIKKVIVAGLSAGGQFVQRFALGSSVEGELPELQFRYVVASPSSYAYLNSVRPAGRGFSVPTDPACAYDDYKYGLRNRHGYMAKFEAGALARSYLKRDVVYLVGQEDDATENPPAPIPDDPKAAYDLDTSCAAELQGVSRLERSQLFIRYLDASFSHRHHQETIPGVAHRIAIFSAPESAKWMF